MSFEKVLGIAALTIKIAAPLAASAGTLTTIYSFSGEKDSGTPSGRLVYMDGAIYGVASGFYDSPPDNGTLFKLDITTHALTVLYRFTGTPDGSAPTDLVHHNNVFYGTTNYGGSKGCYKSGCGTVFSFVSTTGVESVIYRSPDQESDASPGLGGLIYKDNSLYGTTNTGGNLGFGSVFKIDLQTGIGTTLYSFKNGAEGRRPGRTLLFSNGSLYGVTQAGGVDCNNNGGGCGAVFTVNAATGAAGVLHAFQPGEGGHFPESNLVSHKGLIYGTTLYGGKRSCGRGGCGTLFAVDPGTGAETLISTFVSTQQRVNGLAVEGHDLYEADASAARRLSNMHAGQLAKFDLKSGHRTVLYKFEHGLTGADGSQPEAPLVYGDGAFYGSTPTGGGTGCHNNGCGTIFQYVP